MIAGLYLTENECTLAVIDDGIKIEEYETNQEIVDNLEDVDILSVNAPLTSGRELEQQEEELQEEGYIFSPGAHDETLRRRAAHLKQLIEQKGVMTEMIRYDPMITSKELALDGDKALESMGFETYNIKKSRDFDAVLGAVTARFYDQEQFEDFGVIVPEALHNT
ncbi:MAG: hypothetical protein R6V35_06005 [Candidatus Nanohaloarchaea archaeon]